MRILNKYLPPLTTVHAEYCITYKLCLAPLSIKHPLYSLKPPLVTESELNVPTPQDLMELHSKYTVYRTYALCCLRMSEQGNIVLKILKNY